MYDHVEEQVAWLIIQMMIDAKQRELLKRLFEDQLNLTESRANSISSSNVSLQSICIIS